jgi:hypothetical protein
MGRWGDGAMGRWGDGATFWFFASMCSFAAILDCVVLGLREALSTNGF